MEGVQQGALSSNTHGSTSVFITVTTVRCDIRYYDILGYTFKVPITKKKKNQRTGDTGTQYIAGPLVPKPATDSRGNPIIWAQPPDSAPNWHGFSWDHWSVFTPVPLGPQRVYLHVERAGPDLCGVELITSGSLGEVCLRGQPIPVVFPREAHS